MANSDTPNGFILAQSMSAQMAPIHYPVAASQTIAEGDAVILSSGLVQIALSSSGALLGVAAAPITTGASVDRDDTIPVYPAIPSLVFEGQCSGDSTAALVGTAVDIEGATGVMEVNENATTEQVIQIIGLKSDVDPALELGTNDRVFFTIIRSQFDGRVAAL